MTSHSPEVLEPSIHSLDRSTLEQLLIDPSYRQQVERIARKQTRGTTVSWEEAAQSAYLKVLQAVRAGKFRHGDAKVFYRWISTVARFEIIDLVRKEKYRQSTSLDQSFQGTEVALLDTIADDVNLFEVVERSDLVLAAIAAITDLDHRYPDGNYLKLWHGQLNGKNQSQLAAELGVTQGTVSKRWKELTHRLAETLGFLSPDAVKRTAETSQKRTPRTRSTAQW